MLRCMGGCSCVKVYGWVSCVNGYQIPHYAFVLLPNWICNEREHFLFVGCYEQ